jgi:hypothetical protein
VREAVFRLSIISKAAFVIRVLEHKLGNNRALQREDRETRTPFNDQHTERPQMISGEADQILL